MTQDSAEPWVNRYRAAVEDTPAPVLDESILGAARNRSATHRGVRRFRQAFLTAGLAVVGLGTVWSVYQPTSHRGRVVTDYGRMEGMSRSHLLEIETPQFTSFGSLEVSP